MSFFEFLADLTLTDWALLFVAWVIIAFALGTFAGRGIKRGEQQKQADLAEKPRDWRCSDGQWRSEAEAADWAARTDGSLAEWLAAWPTDAEPLYVPREWVA